jgi:hypothetical protein
VAFGLAQLLVTTNIGRGVRIFRHGASGCRPHPARVIHESTWAANRQNSHCGQVCDSIDGAAPSERPPQLETLLSEIFLAWRFASVPSSVSYLYSLSLPQKLLFTDFASSIPPFARSSIASELASARPAQDVKPTTPPNGPRSVDPGIASEMSPRWN